MCPATSLSAMLRDAVESGDWSVVRERLTESAVLDSSSETGRRRVEGADAIVNHLSVPGPGEVPVWDAKEWDSGVAVTFEWHGESGADRRRWYVRAEDGRIVEIWSTAARPDDGGEGSVPTAPAALLTKLGATRVTPLSHGGNSGAALLRAESDGSDFILKRVGGGGSDWLARATDDRGRTAQLYEAGVFERMPASIGHGVVAVEREGDAAWVAMHDVGSVLMPGTARLSREESRRILATAADLHRAFRGESPPGAATLAARIGMSSPAIGEAERNQPDLLPKQFEQGWDAFGELVSNDVADAVLGLASDVGPLADALAGAYGGTTLIHGDLRGDNLGWDGSQLVLIDWDLAAAGTPGAEFAWYLAHSARRIDASHEEIEQDLVAVQAEEHSEAEHELGLLSGLVQYGWRIAHSARIHTDPAETEWGRAELNWWVPRVRLALEREGSRISP
jgi:Phosphotransferase enzyme family